MSRILALLPLLIVGVCRADDPPARHVVVISIDGLPATYLDNPKASLPVIRGLAKAGVAASGGMRVSNPSVTWPNHTTLMTGVHPDRHGVFFNGVLERGGRGKPVRVNPSRTQQDLVRVPLLFDLLAGAGKTSAAINWPCTRGSTTLADNFPDVPQQVKYSTPRLMEELERSGHLARFEGGSGPARDEVWTEAACRIIQDRMPSLLALHLLNLDGTHHNYGPESSPGLTASALTDALVGRVLDALDEAGVRDRTAVFIVSDHGFAAYKKQIRPNVMLRREGLLGTDSKEITFARVHVIPEGGIAMLYLTDPATADADREAARRLFRDAEGIADILGPDDFAAHHLPKPNGEDGMADLILVAEDGYSFSGSEKGDDFIVPTDGTKGAHGYLAAVPKMNAIFVASGAGIKAGADLGAIDNVDLAPTAARLLGLPLEQAAGRALDEILATSR